jgi:phosphoribosylglycinamide formyltransferase-1
MMNIAVFASGRGTNFSAIAGTIKSGRLKVNLALLISDQPQAGVLTRAKRAGVNSVVIERKHFAAKKEFEEAIAGHLRKNRIDLIVLAGFMRVLSPEFTRRFYGKIINIHPSLLPAFKGTEGIKDAFDYGVKVTGVTVHFVDELMDHGPIILQGAVKIEENDTPCSLEAKVHRLEHRLYPEAIRLLAQKKVKINGRTVRISNR